MRHDAARLPPGDPLHIYIVTSENGEREWHADSASHAREQHLDAFDGDPGEAILAVRKVPPPHAPCDGRPVAPHVPRQNRRPS
jgi:hypothetical protein